MLITFSTIALSLTSLTLFLATLRLIYKSSSSFILRQYLSRAIDASPALLFHPYSPSHTFPSSTSSSFTFPCSPLDYSTSQPHPLDSHTCRTPPSYIFTPSFGFRTLLASRRAAKEGKLNELWEMWLRESGSRTVEVRMLGCRIVLTDEGGNVEEILARGDGWVDGGQGWFGGKVLGQGFVVKKENEEWGRLGVRGTEIIRNVEELVEKLVGSRRDVDLEELCEKMAEEMEQKDKVTVRYDVVATLTEDEKSITSGEMLRDFSQVHSVPHFLKHTLYLLAQHPSILSRLHTDISKPHSTTDAEEMTYLSAILHETRRLYPLNPLILRQAQKDTYLPHSSDPDHPLLVPKGAYVACLVGSLNRRTGLFGLETEVFKPERWIDGSCRPGRGYGLDEESHEMKVVECVLVEFLKRWEIEEMREDGMIKLMRRS